MSAIAGAVVAAGPSPVPAARFVTGAVSIFIQSIVVFGYFFVAAGHLAFRRRL